MEHSDDELPTDPQEDESQGHPLAADIIPPSLPATQPPSPDAQEDGFQTNLPADNIAPLQLPASQPSSSNPHGEESGINIPIIRCIPPSPVKSIAKTSSSPRTTPERSRTKRRANTDNSNDLTPKKSRGITPPREGSSAAGPSRETGSPPACAQATQSQEHRQTTSEPIDDGASPSPHGTRPQPVFPHEQSSVRSAGLETVTAVTRRRTRSQTMSQEPQAILGHSGFPPSIRRTTRSQSFSPRKMGIKRRGEMTAGTTSEPIDEGASSSLHGTRPQPVFPDEQSSVRSADLETVTAVTRRRTRSQTMSQEPQAGPSGLTPVTRRPTRSQSFSPRKMGIKRRGEMTASSHRTWFQRFLAEEEDTCSSPSSETESPSPRKKRRGAPKTASQTSPGQPTALGTNEQRLSPSGGTDGDRRPPTSSSSDESSTPPRKKTRSTRLSLGDSGYQPASQKKSTRDSAGASGSNVTSETESMEKVPEPEGRPTDADTEHAGETETTEIAPEPAEIPTNPETEHADETETTETVAEPEEEPTDAAVEEEDDDDDIEMVDTVLELSPPMGGDDPDDQVVPEGPAGGVPEDIHIDPQPDPGPALADEPDEEAMEALIQFLSLLRISECCTGTIACPLKSSIFPMRRLYRIPAEDWFDLSRIVHNLGAEDLARTVYNLLRIAHQMEPVPRYGRYGEIFQVWDTPTGRQLHEMFERRPLFIVILTHIFVSAFYDFNRNHSTFAIRFGIGNAAALIMHLAHKCYFLKFCKIRAEAYVREAINRERPESLDRDTEVRTWGLIHIPRVRFVTQIPAASDSSVQESGSSETIHCPDSSVVRRNVWVLEPTTEAAFRRKLSPGSMGRCPPHYGSDVIPGLLPPGFRFLDDDLSASQNRLPSTPLDLSLRRREPPADSHLLSTSSPGGPYLLPVQRPQRRLSTDPAYPSTSLTHLCPCAVCDLNNQNKGVLVTPDGQELSCRKIQNAPCFPDPGIRPTNGPLPESLGISYSDDLVIRPISAPLSEISGAHDTDDQAVRPTQEQRSFSTPASSFRPPTDPHADLLRIARNQVPTVEPATESSPESTMASVQDAQYDGLAAMIMERYESQRASSKTDEREAEELNPEELLPEEPMSEEPTPEEPTPEFKPTLEDPKGKRSKYSQPKRSKPKISSGAPTVPRPNAGESEEPMSEEPRPEKPRPEEPTPKRLISQGRESEQSECSKPKRPKPETVGEASPISYVSIRDEPSPQLTNVPPVEILDDIQSVAGTSAGNLAVPSTSGPLDGDSGHVQDTNSYQATRPIESLRTEQQNPEITRIVQNTHVLRSILQAPSRLPGDVQDTNSHQVAQPIATNRTEQRDPEVARIVHNTHVLRSILEAPPLYTELPRVEPPNLLRHIRELFENPDFCYAVQSRLPGISPAEFGRNQPRGPTCSTVDSNSPAFSGSFPSLEGIPPRSQHTHMDIDSQIIAPGASLETISRSAFVPVIEMIPPIPPSASVWGQTVTLETLIWSASRLTSIPPTANVSLNPPLTSDEEQIVVTETISWISSEPTYTHPIANSPTSQTFTSVAPEAAAWISSEPTYIHPIANNPTSQTLTSEGIQIVATEAAEWISSEPAYILPVANIQECQTFTSDGRRDVVLEIISCAPSASRYTPPMEIIPPTELSTIVGRRIVVETIRTNSPTSSRSTSISPIEIIQPNPLLTGNGRRAVTPEDTSQTSSRTTSITTMEINFEDPSFTSTDTVSGIRMDQMTLEQSCNISDQGTSRVTEDLSPPSIDSGSLTEPSGELENRRFTPEAKDELSHVCVGVLRLLVSRRRLSPDQDNSGQSEALARPDEVEAATSPVESLSASQRGSPMITGPVVVANNIRTDQLPNNLVIIETEEDDKEPNGQGSSKKGKIEGDKVTLLSNPALFSLRHREHPDEQQYDRDQTGESAGTSSNPTGPSGADYLNSIRDCADYIEFSSDRPDNSTEFQYEPVLRPPTRDGDHMGSPRVPAITAEPNVVPESIAVLEPNVQNRANVEPEQEEVYHRLVGAQFGHIESAFEILQAISNRNIPIEDDIMLSFIQSLFE